MGRARRLPDGVSWGELCPSRACEWHEDEEGAHLAVPRLGHGRFARTIESWLRLPPYRVHLDRMGTYVWRRCDGSTKVSEIVRRMRSEFGEMAEPVEGRVVIFLKQLSRARFVNLDLHPRPAATPADTGGVATSDRARQGKR